MEKSRILEYILYALKNDKVLDIKTIKGKNIKVEATEYKDGLLKYIFINSGKEGAIKFENITNIKLENSEDEKEFMYLILSDKYKATNLKQTIENLEKYYLEVIDILLSKEEKGSIGYVNLTNKKKIYPRIFSKLFEDENNLLFYYFAKNKPEANQYLNQINKREILLIEQANQSQKEALDNALNEKISVIQGPPGTGKTTTILNILANLVYQNKKVLVVSKNNSAIENVVDELEKMKFPKCYIRLR